MTLEKYSNHQLKSLVIDDNVAAIDVLTNYIQLCNETLLVKSFVDPISAISFLSESNCQIDLLFLDVDMPGLNGMDFLSIIENDMKYGSPAVVLTTAHPKYALPALETSKYTRGFLCKPFGYRKFLATLEKIKSQTTLDTNLIGSLSRQPLILKRRREKVVINLNEILYISGSRNSVIVTLKNGRDERFYMAFHKIEKFLPKEQFVRIHKSYIVAISEITSMGRDSIKLQDMSIVFPIGDSYRGNVNQLMGLYTSS